jgi:hypothetical protein
MYIIGVINNDIIKERKCGKMYKMYIVKFGKDDCLYTIPNRIILARVVGYNNRP